MRERASSVSSANIALFSLRIPHEYNSILAREDRASAKRLVSISESLEATVDTLAKLQELVKQQAKICQSKASSLHRRAGLSTLPDEILLYVLKDAAYDDFDDALSASNTVKDALKLSFVCRRFRILIWTSSILWCRLSNSMNIGLVHVLCARLTKPNGVVLLKGPVGRENQEIVSFMQAVVARSEFWTRFVHGFDLMPSLLTGFTRENMQAIARETRGLRAPSLTHLSLHYSDSELDKSMDEAANSHYYSTWSTPKLEALTLSNLVPVPLASGTASTLR